ncbi:MAG: hypothetical protein DMF60_09810 [Acidobacteria bacterium]|nr:MAG: hypothetical protein DMF60_09810 [Acidobacteriota bacterium]
MSIKLTIVFFILICFEIGVLLVILPWVPSPSWNENYLLVLAADKIHWPWLALAMKSGYVRGAVTGLGLLNILLGVWEIINFKKTARAFQMEWQSEETYSSSFDAAGLRDHRPPALVPPGKDPGTDLPD